MGGCDGTGVGGERAFLLSSTDNEGLLISDGPTAGKRTERQTHVEQEKHFLKEM